MTAEIAFYQKVQKTVDTLTSYTTDALSVTHGDKPFANLQQTITDLKAEQRQIWYKMTRFHHLYGGLRHEEKSESENYIPQRKTRAR